ncbi:MAG: hypothetical protein B6I38_01400 [Anaerolineaceae bacterium 4572_5.1]|nr:MAG: hypothetical protein B5M51_05180 [Anaerolinea sp. 4484_236]OQY35599.1 MAG: hypothetical protein B6I38_01400 [Anaerolineaceae bacterium 4572_5.1]RLD05506.1 MAG: hypothetical protein DRI56_09475 [Chloroflexota bacterium]
MTDAQPAQYSRPIDGNFFKELMNAGLTWLRTNQEAVNALNVFPVPDGDTGTNMVLTLQAAYDEMNTSSSDSVGDLSRDLAQGALMGARGNSGVILSQIWRGFANNLSGVAILDAPNLAKALAGARDTAYKGVVRPVEGTILTVIKDSAKAAELALERTKNPIEMLEMVVEEAKESVKRTPELLDVLKDAGVVDAGGKGLLHIFEGMLRYINEQPLDIALVSVKPLSVIGRHEAQSAIEPGQDYEVIVDFHPHESLNLENFYENLEEMGTSIQMGEGEGMYRMHIHVPTEKRYTPIDYIMTLGTVSQVHIENLMEQMNTREKEEGFANIKLAPIEPGQIAVIAVSPGIGFARIFASLGAAAIIEGGQTMNPSTQEILNAFENLPTSKIIILPNNKNILMAAKAAAEMSVKDVQVIPCQTIPQGIAAMLRLMPEQELDSVAKEMNIAITEIESGEITTAVRDVEIDGIKVKTGEIIALHNGKLVAASNNLQKSCSDLLKIANAQEYELITFFYGENTTKQEADKIADAMQELYPEQIVEIQLGGQPHYQFIISIE